MDKQINKLGIDAGIKEAEQICRDYYLWIGIFATILSFTSLFLFPLSTIRYPIMIVYLILHFRAFRQLNTLDGRDLNRVLSVTARNIFLFGILFAIGVFL